MSIGLLLIWAIYLDGSLSLYVQRLSEGVRQLSLLGGGQVIWEGNWVYNFAKALWPFDALNWPRLILISLSVLILLGLYSYISRTTGEKLGSKPLVMISLLSLAFIGITIGLGRLRGVDYFWQLSLVGLLGFLTFIFLELVESRTKNKFVTQPGKSSSDWPLAVGFALIPIASALGTNNNYWKTGSAVGGFFFVSLIFIAQNIYLSRGSEKAVYARTQAVTVFVSVIVSVAIVFGAILNPYRQPTSLFQMKESQVFLGLSVDEEFESYFLDLLKLSGDTNTIEPIPIIDNTGASPTAIAVMGGVPLGSPWIVGSYSGSQASAKELLNIYSAECLASAWVIDEPRGMRRIFQFSDLEFSLLPRVSYRKIGEKINPVSGNVQIVYRPAELPQIEYSCNQLLP
jgi:hypothetical protein